jgi:2-succinyl-5-enolpyruvyl-6-hydroxy-3-cyclohexene-1-carboxylate synthase
MTEELTFERTRKIISECIKSSVRRFVVAPGSRSAPLALSIAENPLAETVVHFDERGAAFHALGMGKATGRPAVVLCTSGTALANFYPAIMEAHYSRTPLIILSADRPAELQDCGSNQTIDQIKLFGNYLRFEVDLHCSDPFISLDCIASAVNQAIYRSLSNPKGPVLINAKCREPFYELPLISSKKEENLLPLPNTRYFPVEKTLSPSLFPLIAAEFSRREKGIIVVGELPNGENGEAILSLAMRLQWPIFADPLSQLRKVGCDSSMISYYNHILTTTPAPEKLIPEIVVHFGGSFVSKPLLKWLDTISPENFYQVGNFPSRQDPIHKVTEKIEMRPDYFCEKIMEVIKGRAPSTWLSLWKEYSLSIEEHLFDFMQNLETLSELSCVDMLMKYQKESLSFFVGNSLPIRFFDSFFFPKEISGPFFGNRGVSGIDGNIATSLGIARGLKEPLLAIIGDLTFLHDVNSLAIAKLYPVPVVFIVFNNDGGGIFQHLSMANEKKYFSQFFQFPHQIKLEKLAAGFGISYFHPDCKETFIAALETSLSQSTPTIIEVTTNSKETFDISEEFESYLKKKISKGKKGNTPCYFTVSKTR